MEVNSLRWILLSFPNNNLNKRRVMKMKRYYKVYVKYEVGQVIGEYSGFFAPPEEMFTSDMQAHDTYFMNTLMKLGDSLIEFDFDISSEFEFKKWNKTRIAEQDFSTGLSKAIELTKQLNHGG